MTPQEEEVLRDLLHGRPLTAPVLVFGLLGGDPNDVTVEELARIIVWLDELGYKRRVRSRFQHATLMAVWAREDIWPGEETGVRRPYEGIALRPDPELRITRAERREYRRRQHLLLSLF